MRIWLPDAPGVLGLVAAEIGAVGGNVVGLEVLERGSGVAIDEIVVELTESPGAIDAVCRGIRNVPGAGVEDVRQLATLGEDREETVLGAATAILGAATPTAALNALLGQVLVLFDLSWMALAELERGNSSRSTATSLPSSGWRPSRKGRAVGRTRPTTPPGQGSSPKPSPTPTSRCAVGAPPPSGVASATRSPC